MTAASPQGGAGSGTDAHLRQQADYREAAYPRRDWRRAEISALESPARPARRARLRARRRARRTASGSAGPGVLARWRV
jgi:hypothetical protein